MIAHVTVRLARVRREEPRALDPLEGDLPRWGDAVLDPRPIIEPSALEVLVLNLEA